MKEINHKNLNFVLHYYKHGSLDTKKAISEFKVKAGIQKNHRWRYVGIAACFLILINGFLLSKQWLFTTQLMAFSKPESYLLQDGSRVVLSPHSTLSYRPINPRRVKMSGKIYFEVKHNPEKPFDIEGNMSHVKVLGTKFQVAENQSFSRVYVSQGRVMFAALNRKEGVFLTKGMSATLQKNSLKPIIDNHPSQNSLAWMSHKFHFDNTPLTYVLQDLSAYYQVPLSCQNTRKSLSGDFQTDSLDSIINIIEQTLNVNIEKKKTP